MSHLDSIYIIFSRPASNEDAMTEKEGQAMKMDGGCERTSESCVG